MNKGDLVKHRTDRGSHQNFCLLPKVGLIVDIDHSAKHRRGRNQEHLGAKVKVLFESGLKMCTEYSLEVINETR